MDAPDVSTPAWSPLRGYFSPATLFLLLNAVIGTIVLTSRSHRRRHHPHADDADHHNQQHKDHYNDQFQHAPPPPPAPLARTSSVMERLRSLGLYRFRSGDFPPEYNYHNHDHDHSVGDDESGKQRYDRSRSEPAARKAASKTGNAAEKAVRAKVARKPPATETEVKKLERAPVPAPARLVQRAPRAPVAARAVVTEARRPEGACVDERADDFINKFRQQLQLQRLNSLLNNKEMLNQGT